MVPSALPAQSASVSHFVYLVQSTPSPVVAGEADAVAVADEAVVANPVPNVLVRMPPLPAPPSPMISFMRAVSS